MELLPGLSWEDDRTLKRSDGGTLRRWGTVEQACRMLDDCDRHDVYVLIGAKLVAGYKLKPWAKNSKWKIDLLSVWRFKQSQLATRQAG